MHNALLHTQWMATGQRKGGCFYFWTPIGVNLLSLYLIHAERLKCPQNICKLILPAARSLSGKPTCSFCGRTFFKGFVATMEDKPVDQHHRCGLIGMVPNSPIIFSQVTSQECRSASRMCWVHPSELRRHKLAADYSKEGAWCSRISIFRKHLGFLPFELEKRFEWTFTGYLHSGHRLQIVGQFRLQS